MFAKHSMLLILGLVVLTTSSLSVAVETDDPHWPGPWHHHPPRWCFHFHPPGMHLEEGPLLESEDGLDWGWHPHPPKWCPHPHGHPFPMPPAGAPTPGSGDTPPPEPWHWPPHHIPEWCYKHGSPFPLPPSGAPIPGPGSDGPGPHGPGPFGPWLICCCPPPLPHPFPKPPVGGEA